MISPVCLTDVRHSNQLSVVCSRSSIQTTDHRNQMTENCVSRQRGAWDRTRLTDSPTNYKLLRRRGVFCADACPNTVVSLRLTMRMPTPEMIQLSDVVPLQIAGVSGLQLDIIRALYGGSVPPPVLTVPHPEDQSKRLLMDGTHRAYIRYQDGASTVSGVVLSTDQDIGSSSLGMTFSSLSEIHDHYLGLWEPTLTRACVVSVADLAIRNCLRHELDTYPI